MKSSYSLHSMIKTGKRSTWSYCTKWRQQTKVRAVFLVSDGHHRKKSIAPSSLFMWTSKSKLSFLNISQDHVCFHTAYVHFHATVTCCVLSIKVLLTTKLPLQSNATTHYMYVYKIMYIYVLSDLFLWFYHVISIHYLFIIMLN